MDEYIKREAVLLEINRQIRRKFLCIANVETIIKDAPAADVAPVVHGRWDGDTCTACKLPWKYNMVQDADDWGYFDPMPDYCPNCGARMDCDAE